jgi:conjugative relaxase-like TrwC/TraI family protein
LAVVATLTKGYDLDYIWKQVDQGPAKDAAGYYIQATESGGEPPGRWWGPGAVALGFEVGQLIERKPYDLLLGEHKNPDGIRLGKAPGGGRKAAEIYTELLAAEPHAIAERKRELRLDAARRARVSPLFFDLTLSLSKSISIFHASLGENARLARQAGDTAGYEYWSGLVAEVDAMIWQAVHAGFDYLQREAGYTRTGSHNKRVNGRETGQWREADLVVAHWLQHASRDGDMQLHVHSQIAHVSRTVVDGKWRAPDSLGYNEHIGAVGAITAQHLEEALTARFGLVWVARDDGHGFEIKGISGEMMRLFSSRRESISVDLRARRAVRAALRPRAIAARSGATRAGVELRHTPCQRRRAGPRGVPRGVGGQGVAHARGPARVDSPIGLARRHASRRPARARRRCRGCGSGGTGAAPCDAAGGCAGAAGESTWTRADVVKYLGRVLPRTGRDPAQAAALLEDLTDRALRGEFEPVLCLEAPEPAQVPRELVRPDGRSVYRRHGGVRYATRAQLGLEEQMVAQASVQSAPRLTRAAAAQALGADLERLEQALAGRATAGAAQPTGTGLREDQAAAALAALTDGRRVSVINAPAGSGKTRVLAEIGRVWEAAGLGPVIGIAASQSARNTLAAGVPVSYNSAQFLGHLPGQRGARGPVPITPGTLLQLDEASMMPTPDLADLVSLAEAAGGKVILAGDTSQLQAVQSGGGMSLLGSRLGYARLAEPVRFRESWERAASLRLRDGDASVLAEYNQHARIIGGDPEEMMDAAAAAYVALTTNGTDVLLMAADHALRRELSRRIRDELVRLGHVHPGSFMRIADGALASVGDQIMCTRNDHAMEAGEPGRGLANGDLLRIDAITPGGLMVRRALDADPVTGRRRWTDRQFLYAHFQDAELGYVVTDHAAQGRTVHTGLALITGTEDRQHAYVALGRGTNDNTAYVYTQPPRRADPAPGPRPAPELARYDRLARQARAPGEQADKTIGKEAARDPLGVLAEVLGRDGQQLSASQAKEQALANADHMTILHAIWTAETNPARQHRYQELLAAALPPQYRQEPSHKAQSLWRTLHSAELAGLDARQVLGDAVAQRDLTGVRDIHAVIDARIRRSVGTLVPVPASSWSAQLPEITDPEQRAYAAQIAQLMDARKERIGEHAVTTAADWAVSGLGSVPEDAAARRQWQHRAASIGAYRELSGHQHPADPIGPEPATGNPDLHAAWHEALAALGPADGPDIRGMTDGLLIHLRDTYPIETA